MRRFFLIAALAAAFLSGSSLSLMAAVAQWDFNGDLSSSTGGEDLIPMFAAPASEAGVTFETATIEGEEAQVAHLTRGTYFKANHGFAANGGGDYVNQYSVVMDVMFPDRSPSGGWAALWQTNLNNTNDGDWFINPNGGVGIMGQYGGQVEDGTWYRLALVVDLAAGTLTGYINGEQVIEITRQGLDGRFALYDADDPSGPFVLLFADESQENAELYVNCVQLRDYALTSEEVQKLGGPTAQGIPVESECAVTDPADDCNGNGIHDRCDIRDGTSQDCNNNGVPDECDLASGTSQDCNENGIPDECDIASGIAHDCNGNGVLDECELAAGTAQDCNENGILDQCEMAFVIQWDFDGTLEASPLTGGESLLPQAAAPAEEPGVTFETVSIGDEQAQVAHFTRGTYFVVHHRFAANGGGAYVNQYTVIMDVMFPDRSPSGGWASLFQTNDTNSNDGDWFINPAGGIGISGQYGGAIGDGEWHRLALAVDLTSGTYTCYIDGEQVNQLTDLALDGRFSLYPLGSDVGDVVLVFADESEENAEAYINCLQLRNYAMSADEVAALGGPTAAGLTPPTLDCNGNGTLDECDIASGTSPDTNGNGVPDECEATLFTRGNVNGDANLDIADAVFLLSHLFAPGSPAPTCMKSADVNDDSQVDIADPIYLLNYLFAPGSPAPPPPFEECGTDPTPDDLSCESFEPCE